MQSRLPNTVKIAGFEYQVKRVAKLKVDGDQANGASDDDALTLELRKGMKRAKSQEFLLHEILHSCLYAVQGIDSDTEEKFVTAISHRLLQVLKDNPKLISYLTT